MERGGWTKRAGTLKGAENKRKLRRNMFGRRCSVVSRENGWFACRTRIPLPLRIYRARLKRKSDVTRLKDRVA